MEILALPLGRRSSYIKFAIAVLCSTYACTSEFTIRAGAPHLEAFAWRELLYMQIVPYFRAFRRHPQGWIIW